MNDKLKLTPLTVPRVNLNGDTETQMIAEIIAMRAGLFDLMKLMRGTCLFHGRNFQTLEHHRNVASGAQTAWDERVQALLNLYGELGDLAEAIQDQSHPKPTMQ